MENERHECQICGRQIKAKNGKIAHHGYERPGWGYQTSSCAGARHVPYDKGHDAIDRELQRVPEMIESQKKILADWIANPPAEITERQTRANRHNYPRKYAKPEGFDPAKSLAKGYGFSGYDAEFMGHASIMKRRIEGLTLHLGAMQERLNNWKGR